MSNDVMVNIDKQVSEVLKTTPPEARVTSGLSDVANTHRVSSRFLLVDTKPDFDIEWSESYQCDSWKDAYGKMTKLVLESSPDNLESNLINGNSIIKAYSAQTFDMDGVRHVYHIIGI